MRIDERTGKPINYRTRCAHCHGQTRERMVEGKRRTICIESGCGYIAGTDRSVFAKPRGMDLRAHRDCPDCKGVYRSRRVDGRIIRVCDDCGRRSDQRERPPVDHWDAIVAAHKRAIGMVLSGDLIVTGEGMGA